MKVNELMLDDWVLFVGDLYKIQNEDFSGNYNFEPIPLTEEILKKNGYIWDEKREAWYTVPMNGFAIQYNEESNDIDLCIGVFNPYTDIDYHAFATIKYVHEFQHALKLCKIEKEIIL